MRKVFSYIHPKYILEIGGKVGVTVKEPIQPLNVQCPKMVIQIFKILQQILQDFKIVLTILGHYTLTG